MTTGSNTQILIKRSTGSANPGTLKSGELAYSYQSNTLFIGTPGSDSYLEIGGQAVVNKLNSAYNQANSANDLAQSAFDKANTDNSAASSAYDQANAATSSASAAYGRANAAYSQANSATSSASAAYDQANAATSSASAAYGQANAATSSASAAYGQANAATSSASAAFERANASYSQANAATSSASAAYGQANAATSSASAAYGQANAATNSAQSAYDQANATNTFAGSAYDQANTGTSLAQSAFDKANNIVTSFTIADTNGHSNTISSNTQLNFIANTGITTYVGTDESLYIGINYDNVIGANGAGSNYQTIDGTITITGDLLVNGNIAYTDTATVVAQNSLIFLANNNTTSDLVDIGFVGQAFNGDNEIYSGLFRHAGDAGKDYYLFDNYTVNPLDTFTIDPFTNGFALSTLHANLTGNVDASLVQSNGFLAAQGTDFNGYNGYSFKGDGGYDTGMFSPTDGTVEFYANETNAFEYTNALFTHHTDVELRYGSKLGDTNDGGLFFGQFAGYTNQGYRAVAIGRQAGNSNQGGFAVAVGLHAGETNQGTAGVAIGHVAGQTNQGQDAVAVGVGAGENNQGLQATAIGNRAGAGYTTGQGEYAVAIGALAGYNSQAAYSIAINASGSELNPTNAGFYVNPIREDYEGGGKVTAYNTTTKEVVYTGVTIDAAGITLANGTTVSDDGTANVYIKTLQQATSANIAFYDPVSGELTYGALDAVVNVSSLANNAHTWYVDSYGNLNAPVVSGGGKVIAAEGTGTSGGYTFGQDEGDNDSGMFSPADGQLDFYSNAQLIYSANGSGLFVKQGDVTLTGGSKLSDAFNGALFGQGVDVTNSNTNRVSIGTNAGNSGQSEFAVAIGSGAGQTSQGWKSVAIGNGAGNEIQSDWAVAIGLNAGTYNQGNSTVAVGHSAGRNSQGRDAVAIGVSAGQTSQGQYAVAIGERAAYGDNTSQGEYAVAIGARAGYSYQSAYSIILNASGSELNADDPGLFVDPVRYTEIQDGNYDGLMFYNSSTKEVRYSYTLDGGSF